jgi:hypothetical protein
MRARNELALVRPRQGGAGRQVQGGTRQKRSATLESLMFPRARRDDGSAVKIGALADETPCQGPLNASSDCLPHLDTGDRSDGMHYRAAAAPAAPAAAIRQAPAAAARRLRLVRHRLIIRALRREPIDPGVLPVGPRGKTTDGWREAIPISASVTLCTTAAPPVATARTRQIQHRSLPSPVNSARRCTARVGGQPLLPAHNLPSPRISPGAAQPPSPKFQIRRRSAGTTLCASGTILGPPRRQRCQQTTPRASAFGFHAHLCICL